MSRGDKLCLTSPGRQQKRLYDLAASLEIQTPYRWYSLCRGGATHEFRKSNSLPAVCLKGRWSSVQTPRIYLNDGVAALSDFQLPAVTAAKVRALATRARKGCPF